MLKEDSALRTIGEVAEELNLPAHVLRFWETKFSQLKPNKRRGRHRYYRPEDIENLKKIRHLLYEQGYTIKGAQKFLRTERKPGQVPQADLFALQGESAALQRVYVPRMEPKLGREEVQRLNQMLEEIAGMKQRLHNPQ